MGENRLGVKKVSTKKTVTKKTGATENGTKKVLNVGGNNKKIPLPHQYSDFEHVLLDIDPRGSPDIQCDARELHTIEANQFDAIYCSHNLEHYYRHDVPKVLSGFLHVLKEGGVAHIRVPDMQQLMRQSLERGLDIDDVIYNSSSGPIMVLDVIYGYSVEIEKSGKDFYAHKTGFTQKSLLAALTRTGFSKIASTLKNLEIAALAFKGEPDRELYQLFNIVG
jgi:SAM-dependent methyltransferase